MGILGLSNGFGCISAEKEEAQDLKPPYQALRGFWQYARASIILTPDR